MMLANYHSLSTGERRDLLMYVLFPCGMTVLAAIWDYLVNPSILAVIICAVFIAVEGAILAFVKMLEITACRTKKRCCYYCGYPIHGEICCECGRDLWGMHVS